MATKIVLNKKNAKDEYGILGIQSFDGGKKKKSLGIKVSVEDFNNHFNNDFLSFNPKITRFKEINTKISEGIYKFENGIEITKSTDSIVKTETIKVDEKPTNKERLSFIDYFNTRMELKKTEGHKYSVLNVRRKLDKFLLYSGKEDLYFDELTPEFIIRFRNYCLTVKDPRKLNENGLRNYFKVIKSVYNDAHNTGYYHFKVNPFSLYKHEKGDRKEKKPLDKYGVSNLLDMNFDYKHRLALNMFYFAILANGMRCSDLMFLRYKNIVEGRLIYKMMKTSSELKIIMNIKMILIIAELLGEMDMYHEIVENTFISNGKTPNDKINRAQLLDKIIDKCMLVQTEGYFKYGRFIIKKGDIETMNNIDSLVNVERYINERFTIYMKDVISKQDGERFIFLEPFSKKASVYFKNFQNGDSFTFEEFQKYKAVRNLYNIRLRNISKIYNDKIPMKTKDRWKSLIHLSSHVARNTFVNILLKENTDVYIISKSLAHTELKTTQNYISTGFDNDASDDGSNIIHNII